MKGFITLEATCPSAAAQQRHNGNEIGLSPGGRSHHFGDEGVHHFDDEGVHHFVSVVNSGAVVVKSAFLGERPHRRRSALGVMDRYGDTVGGLLLIPSRFGVTPSPALKWSFRNTARPRRSPAPRRRVRP